MKLEHIAKLKLNNEVVEVPIATRPATKATGYMFDRFVPAHYLHLTFALNVDSELVYDLKYGDLFPLDDFIKDCQTSVFVDYDGHCDEIVLDGKVVWSKGLCARDIDFYAKKLKELNRKHDGKLQIAWYNK